MSKFIVRKQGQIDRIYDSETDNPISELGFTILDGVTSLLGRAFKKKEKEYTFEEIHDAVYAHFEKDMTAKEKKLFKKVHKDFTRAMCYQCMTEVNAIWAQKGK